VHVERLATQVSATALVQRTASVLLLKIRPTLASPPTKIILALASPPTEDKTRLGLAAY
jgi:hypothetical protein